MTENDRAEAAAYDAWLAAEEARLEAECGRVHVTGPRHDPTYLTCDLPTGHDGRHEGVFIDDHRIKWGRGA
jgi:hypothetical protein